MVNYLFILNQVEFAMEAVTFTEFIYEEALQTAFFALSNATRAKQYELGKSIYYTIKNELYPDFAWFVDNIGFIGIYSWSAFKAFKIASNRMLDQYAVLLGA